ncbi:small G protein signaling modulator 2 [Salmo trutta]|uniref:small G protein signaling modulator 2 n=1 Tax=Salmo trutta TaxID=8032 RepID=UPI001131BB39|nr:small G protein signaling modulator 2-like [Salmo trutta]
MGSSTDEEFKEKLLWNVKREVKQIMEEAVTKKFVHEDSSHIIGLCSTIEACLSHLLKRRAAGFLRSDKIAALFTKIGKVNATAGEVCQKVQEQLAQQAEVTRLKDVLGASMSVRVATDFFSRLKDVLGASMSVSVATDFFSRLKNVLGASMSVSVATDFFSRLKDVLGASMSVRVATRLPLQLSPSLSLTLSLHPSLSIPPHPPDHGEMMDIQGAYMGGSPSSWQQGAECTSHMSSCLPCTAGGSNVSLEYPAGCTCIHDRSPLKMLCQNMKRQIVSRAFYGWLAYCRHLSTVRTHLSALVNHNIVPPDKPCEASGGLSKDLWSKYQKDCKNYKELELLRLVYYGGVQHDIRKEVWPFLLGHYKFGMGKKDMSQMDEKISARYQQVMKEWKSCEVIVKQREKEMQSAIFAKLSSGSSIDSHVLRLIHRDSTLSNEVFMSVDEPEVGGQDTPGGGEGDTPGHSTVVPPAAGGAQVPDERPLVEFDSPDSGLPSSRNYSVTSGHSQILSSIDDGQSTEEDGGAGEEARTQTHGVTEEKERQDSLSEERLCSQLDKLMTNGNGGAEGMPSLSSYTIELLDTVALNLHRIDKDVQRCDRNYYYFTPANLEKLRNIMCSYVWDHLEMGYVQGMCDLLAPLMVILDDECLAYSCFTQLMKRMSQNFPNGGAMDTHFTNMRSLIQILDSELFELMHQNGDYTHFYFCYRWFLLDFKRELLYQDVFSVWEVIWAAPHISSQHFVLFLALALVEVYREIIRDNTMDFTDIIKFFNEMAERHDVQHILQIARELVHKVQSLIENK